jgi:hypothetical protein
LHQDWDRIARGLADLVIGRGWWPQDGSKLDFAKVVAPNDREAPAALRRWGRATLLLEQVSGRIDRPVFRRLLGDHFENSAARTAAAFHNPQAEQSICRHGAGADAPATAASMIAELNPAPDQLPVAWCAFGPPCTGVYFPIPLVGELPPALRASANEKGCAVWRSLSRLLGQCRSDPESWKQVREEMARLQVRFEDNCRDLLADAAHLRQAGSRTELDRLVGSFMQHNIECFDEVCEKLNPSGERAGLPDPRRAAGVSRTPQDVLMPSF